MIRAILLPFAALVALAGCETIGGAGQDIEAAGDALTEESNDVQEDL